MKQMWRQNPFPEENQDSDQCISDDEDGDRKFSRNPRNPFQESRTSKDEFFVSPKKALDEISVEEIISDEEENNQLSEFCFISKAATSQNHHEYEVDNQDGASTWDTVLKETKELMCFRENESHASNSEAKKNLKGSGGKVKPRFSFHFHPDKEEVPLLTTAEGKKKVPQVLEGLEDLDHGPTELSITERLEGLQKAKKKQSEYHRVSSSTSSIGPRNMEHPMAEILDGLLQNNGPFKGTPRKNYKIKGKRLRVNAKKNISSLKHRSLGSEEQPEALDSGTYSEEEGDKFLLEADDQNCLKLATSKNEGQMIIDRFHDALDAAAGECHEPTFAISKQIGTGYHGRLQQVMQSERERLMEFLKQSHGRRTTHDEARCIDVKILSRYLDAKLAVCQCSFTDNIKRSQSAQSLPQELVTTELRKTIIFSSKASDNIDLEVGSFIRVHPPWKEVKVLGKEESIILCTYFSQIPPFGQVPVYTDGDYTFFESRAIIRYMAHQHPKNPEELICWNAKEQGQVAMWVDVEDHQFEPPASDIIWQLVLKHMIIEGVSSPDEKVVADAEAKLAKVLDLYEAQLTKSKYLAMDKFTIADLLHLPNLHYLMGTPAKALIDSRPHVSAWSADILARPAWAKVVELGISV